MTKEHLQFQELLDCLICLLNFNLFHDISNISFPVPRDYKKLNVQAYNSSMQSIMVTWVPSPNRAKENVEGYRVMYIDEMSNRYNTIVQGRDASHVELKNLKIYHFYCIRILPFNSRGDGLSSHPVCTYTDMTSTLLLFNHCNHCNYYCNYYTPM